MKRKRANPEEEEEEERLEKTSKAENTECANDIELHLETPLPLEWQRCLDIQSGQIHFYNTKTQKKTSRDPRRSPEPAQTITHGADPLSLDLELNLKCQSIKKDRVEIKLHSHKRIGEVTIEKEEQEMVARVCVKCHLLVVVMKRWPSCPNCKFMNPPQLHSPPISFMASQARENQSRSLKGFSNLIHNKV